jgi:hypothetical protein
MRGHANRSLARAQRQRRLCTVTKPPSNSIPFLPGLLPVGRSYGGARLASPATPSRAITTISVLLQR